MTPSIVIAFAMIVILAVVGLIQGVQIGRLTERVRKLERQPTIGTVKLMGGTIEVGGVKIGTVEMENGRLTLRGAALSGPPLFVKGPGVHVEA